jgi:CubicO group peptidase (beta-lactamase class C family)
MTSDTVVRCARVACLALLLAAACAPAASSPAVVAPPVTAAAPAPYVPPPGDGWARRRPAEVGMDSARLAAAVAHAQASEIDWLRDMSLQVPRNFRGEPYPDILGPVRDRGGQNGIVIRHGYVVAEWGDTERVDMTFSVAKSYLATVAGLALDAGLIRSLDDAVRGYLRPGLHGADLFDAPQNRGITWRHLLNQTSEWQGTLWDKPDVADRRRGRDRTLQPPGTFWEYNDVRVNLLALALLHVWQRPLPEVLEERVMAPIGASETWEWHGYRNSSVKLDGRWVESVSGGGHWGGGLWASTRDHARFGLLMLRRGQWGERRLLSEEWIRFALAPVEIRPNYGGLWWLNTGRAQYKSASPESFFALGAGGNVIWMDPALDLVVVLRWTDTRAFDEVMRLVTAAVN